MMFITVLHTHFSQLAEVMLLLDFRLDLMLFSLVVLITKIERKGEMRKSSRLSGRDPKLVLLPLRLISSCSKFNVVLIHTDIFMNNVIS